MNQLLSFIAPRTHTILGGAAGTIAVLAGASVIPASHMKYWMAAMAVLTYWSKFAKPPEKPQ